ncbi:MAG: PAS domain S-box protein, partial [Halobacteriales archaeon]|nr:PAS domain S-box protein [Halobacteriales archaeon]
MVAPEAGDTLLASILSTSQLAATPLGPCRTTWAHTVEEGLALLAGQPFEACLVDSGLGPGCIAFLRSARAGGWRRPLVLFTSVGQHDMQAAAQAAGASDVVVKTSVSLNTLGRVIQAAIQRSRFEDTLRFGEEMVRILVEGTRDYAIYMLDREGRVMTWNQGAERITGYSPLEVVGHHFSMFFTEEERAELKPAAMLRHAVARGRFEEEGLRVRKDGSQFWANVVVSPLYGADGQLRGFSKVSRDVTVQHQAERERAGRGEVSTEAFRANPVAMAIQRLGDGTFLDVNEAFCRLFGYGRDDLVGRPASDFPATWPAKDRARAEDAVRRDGAYRDAEILAQTRDGTPRRLRLSASKVHVGGEACMVMTLEDVTTARFVQDQMARREARLREGERIAGIASWEWDVASGAVHWSPNMYLLLGVDPAEVPARLSTYVGLVHPDDRAAVVAAMRAVRERPASFEQLHRIVDGTGRTRWMRARGTVVGETAGLRMVGTVQDMTTERNAERPDATRRDVQPAPLAQEIVVATVRGRTVEG